MDIGLVSSISNESLRWFNQAACNGSNFLTIKHMIDVIIPEHVLLLVCDSVKSGWQLQNAKPLCSLHIWWQPPFPTAQDPVVWLQKKHNPWYDNPIGENVPRPNREKILVGEGILGIGKDFWKTCLTSALGFIIKSVTTQAVTSRFARYCWTKVITIQSAFLTSITWICHCLHWNEIICQG